MRLPYILRVICAINVSRLYKAKTLGSREHASFRGSNRKLHCMRPRFALRSLVGVCI